MTDLAPLGQDGHAQPGGRHTSEVLETWSTAELGRHLGRLVLDANLRAP